MLRSYFKYPELLFDFIVTLTISLGLLIAAYGMFKIQGGNLALKQGSENLFLYIPSIIITIAALGGAWGVFGSFWRHHSLLHDVSLLVPRNARKMMMRIEGEVGVDPV